MKRTVEMSSAVAGRETESRLGGRRASVPSVQVFDNFVNRVGLGDEGKDAKTSAAIAKERVGFENPLNQICPSFSESCWWFGRKLGLVSFGVALVGRFRFNLEVVPLSQSARPGGIETKVMNVMFSRLWDLSEDASDKFEDVEGFPIGVIEQSQPGVVVRSFPLVEKGACAGGPMDAGQRERAPQHVPADPPAFAKASARQASRPSECCGQTVGDVSTEKPECRNESSSSMRSFPRRSLLFSKRMILKRNNFSAALVSI